MLGAASCSSEIDEPGVSGDGNIHLTVKLPEQMRTRAISDGTTATTLIYAVYDKATDELVTLSEDQVNFDPTTLTATVDLKLVNGKSYELLFWADAPGNAFYKFVPDAKSIEVDYTGLTNSDESRDAFFASRVFDVTGPINETVELRRPFAQVNLGTDDMNTDAVRSAYAQGLGVSLSTTAYGTLNLSDGTVDDEQTVAFANAAATLTSGETFPYNPNPGEVNPYTWISMDYILTPVEKEVIDATFTFYDGTVANAQTLPVSNVPVQRNYRTNIYGSLLTSPANLQIIIKPEFEDEDYNVNVFSVASADQLVNAIAQAKPGDTINFANDVDVTESGVVNVDKDLVINIPAGTTVTTARQVDTANFVVAPGAHLTLSGGGTLSGDNRIVDVDGELTVEDMNFVTATKTRGSAITVNPGGTATMNGGSVTAAYCGVWVEGDFNMNGGKIKSTNSSSDPEVGQNFSYALRAIIPDCNIVINGGEVEGVQGAVGAYAGNITINGGYFHTHPSFTSKDNFYALYVADGDGHAIVNGGYFWSEGKVDVYYVDNHGTLQLKGGCYEDQGEQVTGNDSEDKEYHGILKPAAGYKWEAISDGVFQWQIVPDK